ncbi:uncharacterized protein FIBRA_02329 [Fibroporia radiculosa]|uniref:Uncharacterized protein n=1 Tax=Fibroporia radiculosa TaxID=599839 RepID=J4H1S8_9APHY|nr:uncharacterized protein FIBRA_02329 [Fibroporia radiculosa]CCM00299.1 predicted protein [Fibroporia radiculosa]
MPLQYIQDVKPSGYIEILPEQAKPADRRMSMVNSDWKPSPGVPKPDRHGRFLRSYDGDDGDEDHSNSHREERSEYHGDLPYRRARAVVRAFLDQL